MKFFQKFQEKLIFFWKNFFFFLNFWKSFKLQNFNGARIFNFCPKIMEDSSLDSSDLRLWVFRQLYMFISITKKNCTSKDHSENFHQFWKLLYKKFQNEAFHEVKKISKTLQWKLLFRASLYKTILWKVVDSTYHSKNENIKEQTYIF